MNKQGIELRFKGRGAVAPARYRASSQGFEVEAVDFTGSTSFNYKWHGERNFLAWHDIVLTDGETKLETFPVSRVRDLRDTLTFIPPGCEITGWSALAPRRNGYTALTFEPDLLAEELQTRTASRPNVPLLYVRDAGLTSTLRKIGELMRQPESPDPGYLEALSLVAIFELDRLQHGPLPDIRAPGRLTVRQERLVREFVAANLARNITLAELASLVGLTRFHFARIFKATFGVSTRQYLARQRIELASKLLTNTPMPVAAIAAAVGIGDIARFATTFRQCTGYTPSQVRRSAS